MALIDKFVNIADAIREKTGKTGSLTLDEMASEIRKLSLENGIIKPSEIEKYVKEEAVRVINDVNAVKKDDSIIFIAMSDTHHYDGQSDTGDSSVQSDSSGLITNIGNLHAAMAAKILAYALDVDFVAHLGDVAWGHKTTPSWLLNKQIDEFLNLLNETGNSIPRFYAIGNHDTGFYNYNNGGTLETGSNLYTKFTSQSDSESTVFGDATYGGYCYRDFESKKLRIFLLNSCDTHISEHADNGMSHDQCQWFIDSLQQLNEKGDASEWKFIVLCHYPADYGANATLSQILYTYVGGYSSVSGDYYENDDFDYEDKATFIAQFHGHTHNFLTGRLNSHVLSGEPWPFNGTRVCIPNAQYNRENYYDTVLGVNFHEDKDYPKTPGTAEDTSFVVNVINPSEGAIHSICYGAGYNRLISFAGYEYFTVTRDYDGANGNNNTTSVEAYASYSETIEPVAGYELKSITVTMGSTDLSNTSHVRLVDGTYKINIDRVTGNINIIVKTTVAFPQFTNMVQYSQRLDSGTEAGLEPVIVDYGHGQETYYYKDTRLGSEWHLKSDADTPGMFTTGYIPIPKKDTTLNYKYVRIAGKGIVFDDSRYTSCRIGLYDASFNHLTTYPINVNGLQDYESSFQPENGVLYCFKAMMGQFEPMYKAEYMVISAIGDWSNLIVTVDEPIKYGEPPADVEDYLVSYSLQNVSSSNYDTSIPKGNTYSTVLTIPDNYHFTELIITMANINITDECYTEEDGSVVIPNVNGNILISAKAFMDKTYTNELVKAGYKENKYISSSDPAGAVNDKNGYYTTGLIQLKDINTNGNFDYCTLYLKNLSFLADDNYSRIAFYGEDENIINANAVFSPYRGNNDKVEFIQEANNVVAIKLLQTTYTDKARYVRLCCSNINEESIITIDQEIK